MPDAAVVDFARKLLAQPEVKPIGLGARDSRCAWRPGYALYGNDITIRPAGRGRSIPAIAKRRRQEGGFPPGASSSANWPMGPSRLRVGILPEGVTAGPILKSPMRRNPIGEITSWRLGPSVGGPSPWVMSVGPCGGRHVRSARWFAARPAGQVAAMPFRGRITISG